MAHITPFCGYRAFAKWFKRHMATTVLLKGDIESIPQLSPKQLVKISQDVSKCANNDIKLWITFSATCERSMSLFEAKDVIKLTAAIDTFYRNLDYYLRSQDVPMLCNLIDRLSECCQGYSCQQLSEISMVISEFALANRCIYDNCMNLFAKVAVAFCIRIAEADAGIVTRTAVAFSRIGILDESLFDVLSQYILKAPDVKLGHVRSALAAFALVDYRNETLLEFATNLFLEHSALDNINDLAIWAFIFSKLNYSPQKLLLHLQEKINKLSPDPRVDVATLCSHFVDLGITIPETLLLHAHVDELDKDTLFHLAPILPCLEYERVLSAFSKFINLASAQQLLQGLKFLQKCPFNDKTAEAFSTIAVHLKTKDLHQDQRQRLANILSKFPPSWIVKNNLLALVAKVILNELVPPATDDVVANVEWPGASGLMKPFKEAMENDWLADNINKVINWDAGAHNKTREERRKFNGLTHACTLPPHKVNGHYLSRAPAITCSQIESLVNVPTGLHEHGIKVLFKTEESVAVAGYPSDVIETDHGPEESLHLLLLAEHFRKLGYKMKVLWYSEWRNLPNDEARIKHLQNLPTISSPQFNTDNL
ncbi:hypothetical protein BdWA1_000538 [Babesia duncani]|uniref:RAP domain-containing protein n=1 Tax=Babesia duncani TaxID=323732 RepID=A0AAD9PMC1_9APIC|nr:hypothetical protein BdWA1_000538 [Babesia duncani]